MSDDPLTPEEILYLEKIDERNSIEIKRRMAIEIRRRTVISLTKELWGERLSFPGIDPEQYAKLKAEEDELGDEFPGYATPIDKLVARFKDRGMKIVFGADPESGNVFVLPLDSDDIVNDSILPKHLRSDWIVNEPLKKLILLSKGKIKVEEE
ncbi:MAG: hypothetical protein NT093_04370 [Candidatus Moranbacteria bacterium]|nr:hypothetical protein [Candidatus Moranbacteria bacterium]